MKVKALASLSTPTGWKAPDEEFNVSAAEADALVARGLVERVVGESESDAPAAKASKSAKAKS